LTLVHVFEVDPALRNKKITFAEFKTYFSNYYAATSGTTFSGNVTITGDLSVFGTSSFNNITSSGVSTFSGIVVQNNATVSGTISGLTLTGTNVQSVNVNANKTTVNEATGTTANFTSGNYQSLSGNTITGGVVNTVSGIFTSLSGTTISGTTAVITTGLFASGTQGAPSVSVGTSTNGLYSSATNEVSVTTSGVKRVTVGPTGKLTVKGLATAAFVVEGTARDSTLAVSESGRCLLGTTTARTDLIGGTRGGVFQIEAAASNGQIAIDDSSLCLTAGHNGGPGGGAGGPVVFFTRTYSNSLGGRGLVASGAHLGSTYFQGTDGSGVLPAAYIRGETDLRPDYAATALVSGETYRIATTGNTDFTAIGALDNAVGTVFTATSAGTGTGTAILDAGNMPGRLIFSTTADGSVFPTERLRIKSTGAIRYVTSFTVATLPSGQVGDIARVNDAVSPTVGATVTGGGSTHALCWYNSTNWTVIGV